MYIQDRYFSEAEEEVLYSVLMNEDEYSLFSAIQERLYFQRADGSYFTVKDVLDRYNQGSGYSPYYYKEFNTLQSKSGGKIRSGLVKAYVDEHRSITPEQLRGIKRDIQKNSDWGKKLSNWMREEGRHAEDLLLPQDKKDYKRLLNMEPDPDIVKSRVNNLQQKLDKKAMDKGLLARETPKEGRMGVYRNKLGEFVDRRVGSDMVATDHTPALDRVMNIRVKHAGNRGVATTSKSFTPGLPKVVKKSSFIKKLFHK